jgi:hypothetical protein
MAFLTTAEAFRALLLALSPSAKAEEIDSYDWFHRAHIRREDCTQEEIDNANRAIKLLCESVRSEEIPLRGFFEENKPSISIDPFECRFGTLDVFKAELECYADVREAWPARTYSNIHCVKSDVDKIVESITKEKTTSQTPPAKAGGRPPVVDWTMVDEEVFRLMDDNDEFSPDDPDWNAQARLEEEIADYCESIFGKRPGETTIKDNIRDPLKRWRQRRSET